VVVPLLRRELAGETLNLEPARQPGRLRPAHRLPDRARAAATLSATCW
jgi:hypothetical protein